MGTVTYPDAQVAAALSEQFVPCRIESAKAPELARKMNVRWLPALIVTDSEERPANVQIGFLPPADLLAELDFGRAMVAMGEKRYDDADALFRRVAERAGDRAPEACFWWAVSAYRRSKDFADCQRLWGKIVERWPDSLWARKVRYALPPEPA